MSVCINTKLCPFQGKCRVSGFCKARRYDLALLRARGSCSATGLGPTGSRFELSETLISYKNASKGYILYISEKVFTFSALSRLV